MPSLLAICAEKPAFLAMLDQGAHRELFADRDVLEIGCGPLGLSLASFSPYKASLRRLVKTEPLPQQPIRRASIPDDAWAAPFLAWVEQLAAEGEYVQVAGEDLDYRGLFDTVVTYNVLDHVQEPSTILKKARLALRPGGRLLVGVDCLSVLGRWRFTTITRRIQKSSILVQAHPHSFVSDDVEQMIEAAGFRMIATAGRPGGLRALLGRQVRPAFLARAI